MASPDPDAWTPPKPTPVEPDELDRLRSEVAELRIRAEVAEARPEERLLRAEFAERALAERALRTFPPVRRWWQR